MDGGLSRPGEHGGWLVFLVGFCMGVIGCEGHQRDAPCPCQFESLTI